MTPDDREAREVNEAQEERAQSPSAWFEFTRSPSVTLLADALLDAPPYREFTVDELAARAGVSDQSVRNHEDTLQRFGLIEPVEDARTERFRVRSDGETIQALATLDAVLDHTRYLDEGGVEPPTTVSTHASSRMETPPAPAASERVASDARAAAYRVRETVERVRMETEPTP